MPASQASETTAPRHVAMVIQRFRPAFSGQGIQVEELCRALARRGVRSTILTAAAPGAGDEVEECPGYEVRRYQVGPLDARSRSGPWMQHLAWRIGRGLWSMRDTVDVVHVHALTDSLYTSWLVARATGTPIGFEMTLLGTDDPLSVRDSATRFRRARFALYRRCDGYVAMSRAFLNSYAAAGLPPERLEVIPQGVDTRRFSPAREGERAAVRAELGIPASASVVLFAGSLIRRKGLDLLVRAWSGIAASRPDAWLLMVGPDVFADPAAERFVQETLAGIPGELQQRVVRTGTRADLERVMRAADLLAFPTRREGFGTVMLEAMATAIPCVVCRLAGITDLVFGADEPAAHGGVIVDQEDAAGLEQAMAALVDDPEEARRIGARGRQRARAEFDFDQIAERYIAWYRSLMSR